MAPSLSRGVPVVYFLRLRSGMLYVGASVDLEQRLDDHVSAKPAEPPRSIYRSRYSGSKSVRPFPKHLSARRS